MLSFSVPNEATRLAAFLVMSDGSEVAVEDGLILGRVKGCDVIVKDTKASRRHARLISRGGVVEIEDLVSSNGTKLNGKAISRRMLRDGDEILIGKTRIVYQERAAASAPAPDVDGFAGGEDLFGDDDDPIEFADEVRAPAPPAEPLPAPAPEPPPAPRPKSEPVRPAPVERREREVFVPEVTMREPKEPPAPEPDQEVLEFADDDVVMVKRSVPKKEPKAKPSAASGGREGGVLQYSKVADRGLIQHDMSQMSGVQRLVLVVVALAVAGGLFYLAMSLTRG